MSPAFVEEIEDSGGGFFDRAPRDVDGLPLVALEQAVGLRDFLAHGLLIRIVAGVILVERDKALAPDLDEALGGNLQTDNERTLVAHLLEEVRQRGARHQWDVAGADLAVGEIDAGRCL